MTIPKEFDPAFIAERVGCEQQIYREENFSKEPMASVLASNPEIYFVPPQRKQAWGTPPRNEMAAISEVQIHPGPSASVTSCSISGPP